MSSMSAVRVGEVNKEQQNVWTSVKIGIMNAAQQWLVQY